MEKKIRMNGLGWLLGILWIGVGSSCIREDVQEGEEGIRPGDRLPEFEVVMHDGGSLSTEDLKGKTSVLVFFHTQCPDCQQELPVIQQLYEHYADNPQVRIVCISREEADAEVTLYWEAHRLTVPYSAQPDRRVYSLFSERGIPRVYVSDATLQVYSVYSDNPLATFEKLVKDVDHCTF